MEIFNVYIYFLQIECSTITSSMDWIKFSEQVVKLPPALLNLLAYNQ